MKRILSKQRRAPSQPVIDLAHDSPSALANVPANEH
jgi:hypothetical protein